MGWWGAIIGAALGWAVARQWGAVLGAIIGFALSSRSVRIHVVGGNPAHAQQVFFRTTFQVMGHIAKADGRVSEKEIRAARAVMAQMNLSTEQQRAALDRFQQEGIRRIAAPMVGGMVSATVLALLVVPAVYYLWQRTSLKQPAGKMSP